MPKRETTPLEGVVPIIPTPFTADEEIDFAALDRLVEFAASSGFCAACLPAYASEFYKLSDEERESVVRRAVNAADGRIRIVAQANHPAARISARTARRYEELAAAMISFALPRIFPLPEEDLFDYSRTICESVSLPVLIQDFNPGGPTVGGPFARRLADACDNFRYLKLEESLMGPKIRAIIEATDGRIGVLEGWGGMYLLDLLPAGICGLMPGLAVADLLQRVWQLARDDRIDEAGAVFQVVLPQVSYALQNSELFLSIEKRLLAARGILPTDAIHVRRATWTPDAATLKHGDWLNTQVVELARQHGLPAE